MNKKVVKTVKVEEGRINLVRHNGEELYTVEFVDYGTNEIYGKNQFYRGYENALKHFNKQI